MTDDEAISQLQDYKSLLDAYEKRDQLRRLTASWSADPKLVSGADNWSIPRCSKSAGWTIRLLELAVQLQSPAMAARSAYSGKRPWLLAVSTSPR